MVEERFISIIQETLHNMAVSMYIQARWKRLARWWISFFSPPFWNANVIIVCIRLVMSIDVIENFIFGLLIVFLCWVFFFCYAKPVAEESKSVQTSLNIFHWWKWFDDKAREIREFDIKYKPTPLFFLSSCLTLLIVWLPFYFVSASSPHFYSCTKGPIHYGWCI